MFDALAEFIVELTEEEGGKAKTSKVAVTMIAYLIKQKFDNDTFIASKLHFFFTYMYNVVGSFLYVTKMADRQERVNPRGLNQVGVPTWFNQLGLNQVGIDEGPTWFKPSRYGLLGLS